jgi:hypothetical protein
MYLGTSTASGQPESANRKVEKISQQHLAGNISNSSRNSQLEHRQQLRLTAAKTKGKSHAEVNCRDGSNRRDANNSSSISREINSNRDARNSMDNNRS